MEARTAPSPVADSPQPLAANLGWLLSQASYTLTTELTAALERLGISPRAYCVLATAMTGDHTQTELAHTVGLDKTTMVVTLDHLEKAGLARRTPSPADRRVRIVRTTEAGDEAVAKARGVIDDLYAEVLGVLATEQRTVLLDALLKLVTHDGPLSAVEPNPHAPRRKRGT